MAVRHNTKTPARWTGEFHGQLFSVSDSSAEGVAEAVSRLQVSRIAVISGRSAEGSGAVDRAVALVSDKVTTRLQTGGQHNRASTAEQMAQTLRPMAPDCILAIGGGSTSDAAKTIAVLLAEGKHAADHVIKFVPPDQFVTPQLRSPKLPIISVPTTFSAGEITGGAGVLLDETTKRTIWDPAVASKAVIFALEELLIVPRTLLASSAMNALAHCAELLYSADRNVFTTSLSFAGTRGLCQALLDLSECNGDEYLDRLSTISTWTAVSGVVLANGRVGLHHAIAQQLGALLGASHSGANAVILPAVLKLNYEMAPDRCQEMLQAFDSTSASDLYQRVSRIRDTSGATTRLRDLNIDRNGLELVASVTLNDRSYRANPAHPSKEQIHDLLESVW